MKFEFADLIQEYKVTFTVFEESPGYFTPGGKWVKGTPMPRPIEGVILPLTSDDLQNDVNGLYTRKDRKIYTTEPLKIGQKIEHNGQTFTIVEERPYNDYTDVYIYIAKGVG